VVAGANSIFIIYSVMSLLCCSLSAFNFPTSAYKFFTRSSRGFFSKEVRAEAVIAPTTF